LLAERRVGVINAAPLAMGLLTEKGPPAWHPAPVPIRDGCRKAVEYCRKKKVSLPKLALQFAASHRDITTTLVGTADPRKIRESVKWVGTDLDYSLLTEVQDVLAPIRNETWLSGRKENN
jgi:L-galactose dehydrogenase